MWPKYEDMLEQVYMSVLRRGGCAIDIGAHIGRHSIPMAKAIGSSGKVYAFEPLPKIFNVLEENCLSIANAKKNHGTIQCFRTALGDANGETSFVYVPDFPEFSGFERRKYHMPDIRSEEIMVPVVKLDSYIDEIDNVQFIKIDAEGGELSILRGATNLIKKYRPVISFELGDNSLVNYSYTSEDYYDYFDDIDYSIYSIFGLKLSKSEFIEASKQQWYWDYVAIPHHGEWGYGHSQLKILVDQILEA
jgi:FkbM family methyltransferase